MKKIILLAIFVFALFWTVNAEKYCTREYNPVVGTDWKTYANPCVAENAWALKKEKKIEKKVVCPMNYAPVTINWVTYSNQCIAEASWAYKTEKIDNEKVLNSYLDIKISFPMPETDSKKFLEKYGKICDTATDGVNSFMIKDGKFLGSTRVWYPENFKPVYTCIAYKWLLMEDYIENNFYKSLEKLSLSEMKKINSVLKNFYEKEKDFVKNFENSAKLSEKIDEMKKTRKLSEKNIAVLDYIKYQISELFIDENTINY